MAIYEFFEVQIVVDNVPLPEYAISDYGDLYVMPETDFPAMCRYVEVPNETEFSIRITIHPEYYFDCDMIGAYPQLNDTKCSGKVFREIYFDGDIGITKDIEGSAYKEHDKTFFQPFKFGMLDIVDDTDAAAKIDPKARNLGCIELKLYRCNYADNDCSRFSKPEASTERIREKDLKGRPIELAASLGEVKAADRNWIACDKIDDNPLVKFYFHYRTKKALQSLNVIEKTPEPLPLEERDPESLSKEEMVELIKRQKASLEAANRWKEENDESTSAIEGGEKRPAAVDDDSDAELVMMPVTEKHKPEEVIELSDSE